MVSTTQELNISARGKKKHFDPNLLKEAHWNVRWKAYYES